MLAVDELEDQLLGLRDLVPQQQPDTTDALKPVEAPARAQPSADDIPLPRFLFSFGLSPSGPASAEALLHLLHYQGMKAVDARLKENGVKSIGSRLKIQTAVQKAAETSSSPPSAAAPRAVVAAKAPVANELIEEARKGGADVDKLVKFASAGDREALSTELKRLGFKTGTRLKLEQALTTVAAEQVALENARVIAEAREAAVKAHREAQRAERAAAQKAAAEAAAVAEEARKAEVAELYAQYQRETLSEVEKLKLARKEANAAKREAAAAAEATGPSGGCSASGDVEEADAGPLLADAPDGSGGVQGLLWHDVALRRDADGDEAHGFFVIRAAGSAISVT